MVERLAWLCLALCLSGAAGAVDGHLKLLAGVAWAEGRGHALEALDLRLGHGLTGPSWAARVAVQGLAWSAGEGAWLPPPVGDGDRLLEAGWLRREATAWRAVRVDRLWLERAGVGWRWRLGRQPLSWGQGMVFTPLDVFAPFPPFAVDREFKPGEDAVRLWRTLPGGVELQAVAVWCGQRTEDSLALAVRGAGGWDWELTWARHRGDGLTALSLAWPWGEAMARMDLLRWRLEDGRGVWEGLINVDTLASVGDASLWLFLEYRHSDLGDLRDPALAARLARGERFLPGYDHLAAGLEWSPHPLHRLRAVAVFDLAEAALLWPAVWVWELAEDWQGEAGAVLARGTAVAGLPRWAYLRLKRYF